ncbi:unnamed protein product [Echinostoma caproni]|uniref:PH domain-containing protein n=1 Tax=Echinostoma caproni TaxID=27848 RepID=A0A183AAQ8_9TREM|nr:unnamed protein product [Echinostoma caproni]
MLQSNPFDAAHENLEKSRGTSEDWFKHSTEYVAPAVKLRVRFEAVEIAERQKQNVSTAVLAGFSDRPNAVEDRTIGVDKSPDSRLRTSEARDNAVRSREQNEKWHDFEGNLNYQSPAKPIRLGAGTDGREIFNNMVRKQDWFQHNPVSEHVPERHSRQTESGYASRDRGQDWFCHRTAKDQAVFTQPTRSRVRRDGEEYALRNRGTADILCMQKDPDERVPGAPYGCPTVEARSNARWDRFGVHMATVFGNSCRLNNLDTEEVNSMTHHSSLTMRPRTAKVRAPSDRDRPKTCYRIRPEAEDYRNKSVSGAQLRSCMQINSSSRDPMMKDESVTGPAQKPRLRSDEAFDAMQRNRGEMSSYLGNETVSVTVPCARKIHPRGVRSSEGQETVLRSKGDATRELLTNDHLSPEPIRKGYFNLPEEMRELAQQSRQGQVGHLLGGRSSEVPLAKDEAPVHRRLHYEAMDYADRQRGEQMCAILNHN